MNETFMQSIDVCCKALKIDFSGQELAEIASDRAYSAEVISAIGDLFEHLRIKKEHATINMLYKTSRLPQKDLKTFENFDYSILKGREVEQIKALATLAPIYSHRNIAFIGPAGVGKTHLAMAFGHACCQHRLKTYFIKASELQEKFTLARRQGRASSVVTALVRPSCLIIDEIGHCEFDKENTRLFFDLIDRRYNKEGAYNLVFTSNKSPNQWREIFSEDDSLLCSLDRIFDVATVFNIRGESYRGSRLETVAIQANGRTNPALRQQTNN